MKIIKYFIFILSLIVVSMTLFLSGFVFFNTRFPYNKGNTEDIRFEVKSGMSVREICKGLEECGVIRSESVCYLSVRFPFLVGRKTPYLLKSGVYYINSAMTVPEILSVLEEGFQEYNKTVIPEGLTVSKIGLILEQNGVCSVQEFVASSKKIDLLRRYNLSAASFEGFLYPDTYFFTPSMGGDDVVCMMLDNFIKHQNMIDSLSGKSFDDIYETVILASIVEREYRVSDEAPLIASVFTNRIKNNIGLYSCATIEYIITEIYGKEHPDVITYDDLKIDNPYNTYKWAGLTPGPISNPGLVALRSAANPPETDYFYFTLTDSVKGKHTFSKTFSSHIKAGSEFKTKKVVK